MAELTTHKPPSSDGFDLSEFHSSLDFDLEEPGLSDGATERTSGSERSSFRSVKSAEDLASPVIASSSPLSRTQSGPAAVAAKFTTSKPQYIQKTHAPKKEVPQAHQKELPQTPRPQRQAPKIPHSSSSSSLMLGIDHSLNKLSRSRSRGRGHPRSHSQQSVASVSASASAPSLGRRPSAPSRPTPKSKKHTEHEFDDDILPDGLVMLNVPLITMDIMAKSESYRSNLGSECPSRFGSVGALPLKQRRTVSASGHRRSLPAIMEDQPSIGIKRSETEIESDTSSHRSSITRPTDLPPKSPEEERMHLVEYTKLVKAAAANDQKKSLAAAKKQRDSLLQLSQDREQWESWLSMSDLDKTPKKMRKLWWRGIPGDVRGRVWFGRMCNSCEAVVPPSRSIYHETIISDCQQIWPHICEFQSGQRKHRALVACVEAFLESRGVKYKSCVLNVAAVLLLYLSEAEAYSCLCAVFSSPLLGALLTGDEQTVLSYYSGFMHILEVKLPELATHFGAQRVSGPLILDDMVASLLCDRLDPACAARIIDVFVFEGESLVLRAALGVLSLREHALYQSRREVLEELRKGLVVDESEFMLRVHAATRT